MQFYKVNTKVSYNKRVELFSDPQTRFHSALSLLDM